MSEHLMFWTVVGPAPMDAPLWMHYEQQQAIDTAERLAAAAPGSRYMVMQYIATRSASTLEHIEQKLADITEVLPIHPPATEPVTATPDGQEP